ncbi:MAG TPA: family 20 glycosylhydrolase [Bacteriovoracaceae bacterium]|nr:family 20 glycosylhydrolase [Bacteriovoracaceae bacterium]
MNIIIMILISLSLCAQIIPQPQTVKINQGLGPKQIKVQSHPLNFIQQSLQAMTDIHFVSKREANLEIIIEKNMLKTPFFKSDESYELVINPKKIVIMASNEYGAFYALESLKQLRTHFEDKLPTLTIHDRPRFPWRGLLIDVARNWIELTTLKKQIDLMATVKLNVLHLHLSDDQAFRIESQAYPKLHLNNRDKKFYTQEEMKELITYASQRNIRVVPEFDVPGHTSSIISAYPELASVAGSDKPSIKYGPHDEAMNPIIEETYIFLERLFTEMSTLFPDEYFHVGGDEVSGKHWMANPEILQYMKEHKISDTTELQFRFTRRMESLIKKLGKKMIAWDEVLKEGEHLQSVAQIWRGPKFAKQAINIKMPVIYSYGYYLDLQLSSESHYQIDPAEELNLKKDPELLWGGEACMWSERTPDNLITSRIWPRAMAVAERLWSAKSVKNVQDFYSRQNELAQSLQIGNPQLIQKIQEEAGNWELPKEKIAQFLNWLEPGKFYSQHRYRVINTETKWNMWVDQIPSESIETTRLNWLYGDWLRKRNKAQLNKLKVIFTEWHVISMDVLATKQDFSEKEDLVALAKYLGSLSRIALETLDYLTKSEKPGGIWFKENRTKLGMIGQIRGGLQIGPHSLVEKMVNKLELGMLKSIP